MHPAPGPVVRARPPPAGRPGRGSWPRSARTAATRARRRRARSSGASTSASIWSTSVPRTRTRRPPARRPAPRPRRRRRSASTGSPASRRRRPRGGRPGPARQADPATTSSASTLVATRTSSSGAGRPGRRDGVRASELDRDAAERQVGLAATGARRRSGKGWATSAHAAGEVEAAEQLELLGPGQHPAGGRALAGPREPGRRAAGAQVRDPAPARAAPAPGGRCERSRNSRSRRAPAQASGPGSGALGGLAGHHRERVEGGAELELGGDPVGVRHRASGAAGGRRSSRSPMTSTPLPLIQSIHSSACSSARSKRSGGRRTGMESRLTSTSWASSSRIRSSYVGVAPHGQLEATVGRRRSSWVSAMPRLRLAARSRAAPRRGRCRRRRQKRNHSSLPVGPPVVRHGDDVHPLGRQLGAPVAEHGRQVDRAEEPRLAALDLVEEAVEGPLATLLDALLPGGGQLAAEVAGGVDDVHLAALEVVHHLGDLVGLGRREDLVADDHGAAGAADARTSGSHAPSAWPGCRPSPARAGRGPHGSGRGRRRPADLGRDRAPRGRPATRG